MTDIDKPTKPRHERPSGIHSANIESSGRLQRVLGMLKDGNPHTKRDIRLRTGSECVATCISELRANGYNIECKFVGFINGAKIYSYTLIGG